MRTSLIQRVIALGAAVYIAIAAWQIAENATVAAGAVAISVLLAALALVAWQTDEKAVKRHEMVLLWCIVLLFGLYGLMVAAGVI